MYQADAIHGGLNKGLRKMDGEEKKQMKKFMWYDNHINVFNMGTTLQRGLYGKGLNNIVSLLTPSQNR